MSALLALAGSFFWLVVYAAAYRGKRQDIRNPAVVHVIFTGGGCIAAGIGLWLLAWALWGVQLPLPQAIGGLAGAGLTAVGMGAVAMPIWYYLPHIAAQPVDADVSAEKAKRKVLEVEVERLRRERKQWMGRAIRSDLERLQTEVAKNPWLDAVEENY